LTPVSSASSTTRSPTPRSPASNHADEQLDRSAVQTCNRWPRVMGRRLLRQHAARALDMVAAAVAGYGEGSRQNRRAER
jgi:hypothetical protein